MGTRAKANYSGRGDVLSLWRRFRGLLVHYTIPPAVVWWDVAVAILPPYAVNTYYNLDEFAVVEDLRLINLAG